MSAAVKIALAGAVVIAALWAVSPAPYTLSNPPPSLASRADRECVGKVGDDREWCRTLVTTRPAFDAARDRR